MSDAQHHARLSPVGQVTAIDTTLRFFAGFVTADHDVAAAADINRTTSRPSSRVARTAPQVSHRRRARRPLESPSDQPRHEPRSDCRALRPRVANDDDGLGRIADRTVASGYFAVSQNLEALYDQARLLAADDEGHDMRKLRARMHRRVRGNVYCT